LKKKLIIKQSHHNIAVNKTVIKQSNRVLGGNFWLWICAIIENVRFNFSCQRKTSLQDATSISTLSIHAFE